MTRRAKGVFQWIAVILIMAGCARALHWNEFESPWGVKTQDWKREMLRAELCK